MSDTNIATRERPVQAPTGSGSSPDAGGVSSNGWMWTWITVGTLVVLVVIGYLIPVSNALTSIDGNLATADDAVTGAGGDVVPLPDHVQSINGSLGSIDTALKPVPGQADQIIAALSSIRDSLVSVDNSLKDTSGSLVNTSGSLVDTSGILKRVLGVAGQIEATLESAQEPADNLGTRDIVERVAAANKTLTSAKSDTGNILTELVAVNKHLQSICQAAGPGPC